MSHPQKGKTSITSRYAKGAVTFDMLQSRNDEMHNLLELALAASQTTATVLISGESGTGKNMLAQAIHNASPRRDRACITVNCSGIPANLLESELFGHEGEPGTGTGSERGRRGKFELASGGTLILDEISDFSLQAQARILRAVEHGQFERAGGETTLEADVRVIALTTRDLTALIGEKLFREDLYYRLAELTLHLPPLRNRREDIPEIIQRMIESCNAKFGKSVGGVSQIVLDYLLRYDFPGNLRELMGMIKRGVTLAKGDQLFLEDLGMRIEVPFEGEGAETPEENLSLAAMERRHIQQVLDYTRGNKKRTSELLQISRPTLDRKIRQYSLRLS